MLMIYSCRCALHRITYTLYAGNGSCNKSFLADGAADAISFTNAHLIHPEPEIVQVPSQHIIYSACESLKQQCATFIACDFNYIFSSYADPFFKAPLCRTLRESISRNRV